MPDISMCAHETCPVKERCYRHEASGTVPTPHRQSWMGFEPKDGGPCWAFLPTKGTTDDA
jgi:hypothetical protein